MTLPRGEKTPSNQSEIWELCSPWRVYGGEKTADGSPQGAGFGGPGRQAPRPRRAGRRRLEEAAMSPGTLLIAALILAFFATLPTWPHSSQWGYHPSLFVGALILAATLFTKIG
jgi:hypothetical protein